MKLSNSLIALAIATLGITFAVEADTVKARCDVYPKGEDRATSSGLCDFSQRQGIVNIKLKNGQRFDLTPTGNAAGKYRDQSGRPAHREDALGNKGSIYRLADKSIYVYWDTAPYNNQSKPPISQNTPIAPAKSTNVALVGTTVPGLSDLVGAKAGQAENLVKQRGYQFVRTNRSGGRIFAFWREPGNGLCVAIITRDGRYDNIVYANVTNQFQCR